MQRMLPKFSVRTLPVRSADKNIEDSKISRGREFANISLKSFTGKIWIVINRIENQSSGVYLFLIYPFTRWCNKGDYSLAMQCEIYLCTYCVSLHKKQWNSSKSDNCKLKGFREHCSEAVIRISIEIEIEHSLIFDGSDNEQSENRIELFHLDSDMSLESKGLEKFE